MAAMVGAKEEAAARGIGNRSVRVGCFSGHLAGEYVKLVVCNLHLLNLPAGIQHRIVR